MKAMYSMRSPAVKRLMKEAQELREPTELYFTQPLEDNLFEWHFTIRGPENSDFDEGLYHGRIILPPEYPMKPPNVIILTPNGRFETNKKICLSISGHHPESWQPSWSIRTALLAIIGFMPTHGGGAIGSLDYPAEERKKLAKRSNDWKCEHCGNVSSILKPLTEASKAAEEEAKELAAQINFSGEKSATDNKPQSESASSSSTSTPITTPPNTPVSANQGFPNMPAMPAMPGQFPFPPFPFPQLANMPNFPQQQQQQGSNFVPRFPYPPQFLPAMFPQMQMPLQNPFASGNQSAGIQSANQTINTTPAVSVNQSAPSTSSGETNMNNSPNTESSSNPTSDQQDTSAENSSASPETVRSEQDSGASTSAVSDGGSAGVRQRHIDNYQPNLHLHVGQSAELPSETRQSGLRISTILIVILLIGIALLVLRRVYLQRVWRFPF